LPNRRASVLPGAPIAHAPGVLSSPTQPKPSETLMLLERVC
jgi:hypothetical protein